MSWVSVADEGSASLHGVWLNVACIGVGGKEDDGVLSLSAKPKPELVVLACRCLLASLATSGLGVPAESPLELPSSMGEKGVEPSRKCVA